MPKIFAVLKKMNFFNSHNAITLIGFYRRHAFLRSIAPKSTTRGFQLFPTQPVRMGNSCPRRTSLQRRLLRMESHPRKSTRTANEKVRRAAAEAATKQESKSTGRRSRVLGARSNALCVSESRVNLISSNASVDPPSAVNA